MSRSHRLPLRELQLKIAVLQRKVKISQDAKLVVREQVQEWNTQYAERRITYEQFDAYVKSYLKGKSLDTWLKYYDDAINVYQTHIRYYEQQASVARERTQNWKYLTIFLVLALTLGAFLFIPLFQWEGTPTGGVTSDIVTDKGKYLPAEMGDQINGNVSITLYKDDDGLGGDDGLDLVPDTTWVNVSIVDAQGGIFNTSSLNISTFIANAMNSTLRDCFNVTIDGKFKDVNGTWPSEGQIGTGYGYNQSLACMDFRNSENTNINTYTVNFTAFFPPFLAPPRAGNGYNITINMTNGTNVERITFAYAAFNTSRPPSITSITINPSSPRPTDNLTAAVAGIADPDLDNVTLNYNWYVNNNSITVLNMYPMTNTMFSSDNITVFDFSGNANHGLILPGGVRNPQFVKDPFFGPTYFFDSDEDDNITIPFSQALNFSRTKNFTIEVWVNFTNIPGGAANVKTIFATGTPNTNGIRLGHTSGGSPVYRFGVDATIAQGPAPILNKWQQVVGTWNGTTCVLYVDGVRSSSLNCPTLTQPGQPIHIGGRTGLALIGHIGAVRLYNRTLTIEQIAAIYNTDTQGRPYYNITVANETRLGEVWNVSATPVDSEGLNGTTTISNSVTITDADITPPVVRLLSPTNATNTTALAINFSFSTSDDGFIAYANLSGTWTNDIFTFNNSNQSIIQNGFTFENFINISHMPEGNWTWNIQVCDVTGNCGWNSSNFTITVDRTAPFVNITQPLNNSVNTTSTFIDVFYNVTDAVSYMTSCALIINNTQTYTIFDPVKNIRQNISAQLVDGGLYNATVSCTDQAGNNGNSTYINFSVGIPFTPVLACTLSDEMFNVSFGDNVQQGSAYNATGNYYLEHLMDANITKFNVSTTGSNIPVNISMKGDHFYLNDFSRMMGVGNVSWNSTVNRSLANFSMFYPGKANLTDYYQNSSAMVATKLFPGGVAWLRYWLTIPQDTYAGKYTANFTILCEDAREQ